MVAFNNQSSVNPTTSKQQPKHIQDPKVKLKQNRTMEIMRWLISAQLKLMSVHDNKLTKGKQYWLKTKVHVVWECDSNTIYTLNGYKASDQE